MSKLTSRVGTIAAAAVILALAGTVGATAGSLITSAKIADNTVRSVDVRDHSIRAKDLNAATLRQLAGRDGVDGRQGATGPAGAKGATGATGLEGAKGEPGVDGKDGKDGATGPAGAAGADGVTNLIAGAGYNDVWPADGKMHTARGECPAGQYALGGGYSTWGGDKDLGGDNKAIQVTVSAPYFEGDYVPVDEAGNFRPTEWVVKGYNNGDAGQIVRAWVTCAKVAN